LGCLVLIKLKTLRNFGIQTRQGRIPWAIFTTQFIQEYEFARAFFLAGTVSKLLYAASAWWGFINASGRQKITAFIYRRIRTVFLCSRSGILLRLLPCDAIKRSMCCHRVSVSPSVRLSVCLSQVDVLQRWLNIWITQTSYNSPGILVFRCQNLGEIPTGSPRPTFIA